MAKSKERLAAVILRRKGASIKEIAKILNVSRGSVSVWCKEVKLTEKQIEKLREKQIAAGHKAAESFCGVGARARKRRVGGRAMIAASTRGITAAVSSRKA